MINWMMAADGFEDYDLSSLRNFQYGGGPMPRSVVEAALKAFPLHNDSGLRPDRRDDDDLFVTGGSSACDCRRPSRTARLMRSRRIRLRNPRRQSRWRARARDGQSAGEIVVRSEANMLGYWRRPDLTEKTLRDGWMWTGDIATWDQEGYVFIVDRAKDMIISGGENIYSTQVEAAIHQHPAVLESRYSVSRRYLGRSRKGGGRA